MGIRKSVRLVISLYGDSTSTSVRLSLSADPYSFQGGSGDDIMNWFSENKKSSHPVGVVVIAGATSATIDDEVVTLYFAVPPSGPTTVILDILFA